MRRAELGPATGHLLGLSVGLLAAVFYGPRR